MAKKTEQYYDGQGRLQTREIGTDDDLQAKAKSQDTRGLATKVKADPFVPPRMEPNEDSAAYSARVARARDAHRQSQAMKK